MCYEAAAFVLTGPLKCSKESALVSEVKYFNLPTRLKRDVKMATLGDECPEPSPQANRSDSSRVFMISDPRGGARRAGATGRADRVRGRSEEAGGREERFPLPARRRLHQTEEPRPGTHRLQLQTQHQGKEASRKHSVCVYVFSHFFKCHHLLLSRGSLSDFSAPRSAFQ